MNTVPHSKVMKHQERNQFIMPKNDFAPKSSTVKHFAFCSLIGTTAHTGRWKIHRIVALKAFN